MKLWFLGSFIFLFHTTFAATEVAIEFDQTNRPYSYREFTDTSGMSIDIVNAITNKLKDYTFSFSPVTLKEGIKNLDNNKSFAMIGLYETPQKKHLIYSHTLFTQQIKLFCRDSVMKGKVSLLVPDDLKGGLSVAIPPDISPTANLIEAQKNKGIKIEVIEDTEKAIIDLTKGRHDCYVKDSLSFKAHLNNLLTNGRVRSDFKYADAAVINSLDTFLVLNVEGAKKFSFQNDFLNKFNQALKELKTDGTLSKIQEQYLK